jgi:nucleoside-diphosphate-sugar epimerase
MNILILGGTGAMGKYLVDILSADENNKIYVTSRKKYKNNNNVIFLCGNAHDNVFLNEILNKEKYDVIVDFMIYNELEFKEKIENFLKSTSQYIFLSSSRVYADTKIIKENSPRLLEVSKDLEYLKTNEYALSKARQENILRESQYKNWTIIRPYITYSDERLQLGIFEKEQWLFRALRGKSIVFFKDIAEKKTTLTYGKNVAFGISELINNKDSLTKAIHITTDESIYWRDVLNIYLKVLKKEVGKKVKVYLLDDSTYYQNNLNKYQVKYDRLYNRIFDNNLITELSGDSIIYTPIEEGLKKCLTDFLRYKKNFREIDWLYEGYADKVTGEKTKLLEICGLKNKIKYLVGRYFLRLYSLIKKINRR